MAFIAYIHDHPEVSVFCRYDEMHDNEKWKIHPQTELILATDNSGQRYINNHHRMTDDLHFEKGEKTYRNPNSGNWCNFFALTLDNIPRDRFIFSDEIKTVQDTSDAILRKFPNQCGLNILRRPLQITKKTFKAFRESYNSIGWLCIVSNDDEKAIKNITELGFIPAFYLSKKTIYFYWSK